MQKIKYLDGLRGLAALLVASHHFLVAFLPAHYSGKFSETNLGDGSFEIWFSTSVFNLFFNGNWAVCIFFVLSGFVLTYRYFLKNDVTILVALLMKRYFRLFIPIVFSVLLVFLLIKTNSFYNQTAAVYSKSNWFGSFWLFNPNLKTTIKFAAYHVFLGSNSFNPALWTIKFEFLGSILVLSVAALVYHVRNRFLVYLLFIIPFLYFHGFYFLGFISGMMLSDFTVNYKKISFLESKIAQSILILLIIAFGSYPSEIDVKNTLYRFLSIFPPDSMYAFSHTISAFLLLTLIIHSPKLQKMLSTKICTFLGLISFSMYLLHLPILGSFSSAIFMMLHDKVNYIANLWITFIFYLMLLLPISYLTAITIDKFSIIFPQKLFDLVFKKQIEIKEIG
jgi:peptidoglycan/LPS O-acetylase OafA/YrhL